MGDGDREKEIHDDVRRLATVVEGKPGQPETGLAFKVEITRRDVASIKSEVGAIKKIGWAIVATVVSTVGVAILNLVINRGG